MINRSYQQAVASFGRAQARPNNTMKYKIWKNEFIMSIIFAAYFKGGYA